MPEVTSQDWKNYLLGSKPDKISQHVHSEGVHTPLQYFVRQEIPKNKNLGPSQEIKKPYFYEKHSNEVSDIEAPQLTADYAFNIHGLDLLN